MNGIQIEFDEHGNLIFTADEETRASIRELQTDMQRSVKWYEGQLRLATQEVHEAWASKDPLTAVNSATKANRKRVMADAAHKSAVDRASDASIFLECIEYYLCNGYSLVHPEDIGALWDGLILSDTTFDGETTTEEANSAKVWVYDQYAVRSYLADLLETGHMKWRLHKETP